MTNPITQFVDPIFERLIDYHKELAEPFNPMVEVAQRPISYLCQVLGRDED